MFPWMIIVIFVHMTFQQFERNQQLSLYFMDLMVCYIRVMLLFSSMAERKMVYAVFTAAAAMASLPRSTFWNE